METFIDYFSGLQRGGAQVGYIHSCAQLIDCIGEVGFLPLLESGIEGYCAEQLVTEDCRYVVLADGTWEWPLWQWKGEALRDGGCVYGKFFAGKAGFVSRAWWPDLANWRRSRYPEPAEGSVEEAILATLRAEGSMVARELRAACGMTGKNMRSRFDACVARLQMATYIVTADFVYPRDQHGREYGFGWSLLTTPERLLGHEACRCDRTPDESRALMDAHLARLLPTAPPRRRDRLIG